MGSVFQFMEQQVVRFMGLSSSRQIAHPPQTINDTCCHRWGTANRAVDAAEIIGSDMNRGRVCGPFFFAPNPPLE
jgi:hypothetical protein